MLIILYALARTFRAKEKIVNQKVYKSSLVCPPPQRDKKEHREHSAPLWIEIPAIPVPLPIPLLSYLLFQFQLYFKKNKGLEA